LWRQALRAGRTWRLAATGKPEAHGDGKVADGSEASNFATQSRQVIDNTGKVCGFEQIKPNLSGADGRLRIADLQAGVAGPFPINYQSTIEKSSMKSGLLPKELLSILWQPVI
jgi:hypothetical protein